AVAHDLEQRGALVVNSWASSSACQDRVAMSQRMQQAHLPWPLTWSLAEPENAPAEWRFPLMIKSRYSYRGDLVAKVDGPEQLQLLARQRKQAPFILQEFVPGDGWDIKLWAIGRQVFTARRRTPLKTGAAEPSFPMPPESEWVS